MRARTLEAAMNLTRLGELLDLVDNAALTASQARELAHEQAELQAATAWTVTAPTRPGLYAWRGAAGMAAMVIRVIKHPTGILATCDPRDELWRDVAAMGGVWSGPLAGAKEATS
jgi:hypothetical protein